MPPIHATAADRSHAVGPAIAGIASRVVMQPVMMVDIIISSPQTE
jgi:hypothetical protein